jgi:beta-galactosidase
MKSCTIFRLLLAATLTLAAPRAHVCAQDNSSQNQVRIDASATIAPPETGYLHLGGTSSNGHSLQVNSRYLVLDGKPWLPVMGEFHFSRYPESQWEDEILKMKAGGVNIVSTYIFWIHHEEVQGQFDWSGRRDLRRFVQLCAKHGMYVWLRVGPWAHGEVRNGGFPDWIAKLPNVRTNDPTYIRYVELFFNQIGLQVRGLMFKDGGPVIGTQLENEYGLHGPGRGAEHILKLKQLALAAGIEPPIFSVTGWPSLDFPPHEVVPVSGGYPDGFWYASQTNLPPDMNYLFNFNRELGDMGATVPSEDPTGKVNLTHDPYFAAEEGGGMASAYHRRPVIDADDVAAQTLTGLGSGINLYGYYMYHGGANPKGILTTLQESTATGYANDLPEVTYDFNAPLGEFGQERESYRKTRPLHLFLNAFGTDLAPMPAFAPARRPSDAADTTIPRVAVRTNGKSGFIFVNNYVRQLSTPARPGFQVQINLPGGQALVPAHPVDVPAGAYFVWPFNMAIGRAKLNSSTAQLLTRLDTPAGRLFIFFAIPGIAPEFSFDASTIRNLWAPHAAIQQSPGVTSVTRLTPGLNAAIEVTDSSGVNSKLLVLTQQQAEETTLFRVDGRDHLALSASSMFFDGQAIHLRSTASPSQELKLLPDVHLGDGTGKRDGLWTLYAISQAEKHPTLSVKQMQIAAPRAKMDMGPYVDWRKAAIPVVPPDSAFFKAGIWKLQWKNPDMSGLSEILLQLDYTGDIGRLNSSTSLLDDNFFNGLPWQIGLKRFGAATAAAPLTLQLLPMPAVAPIYLDPMARAQLASSQPTPKVIAAKLIPEYESILTVTP